MSRIDVRWPSIATNGTRAALLCGLLWLAIGAASARASVPLTMVSSDPYLNTSSYHATQVEPDTFAAGSTMVSTFQSGRFFDGGSSNIGWATTTNSGASWSHGFLPATTTFAKPAGPYARATDPSAAYDPKHKVWMINSLVLSASVNGVAILVSRSTNGGLTWGNPVTVLKATGSQNWDKNWIVCDGTPTSPHYGNCYAEWDDFGTGNQLHMAVSTNGGLTWTQSKVPSTASTGGVIGGQPLVQPNGHVVMPIDNGFETAVESFVSTNGGVSYTGPFTVTPSIATHGEAGSLRSPSLPTAEIDKAGKVYVAWSDCRFISACTANDIVYSSSTDGIHWSAVTRIPIDSTTSGRDHFLPGLGVDRNTSGATTKLALTYYFYPSTNCTTATCQLDVGYTRSADAGAHWTAPVLLAGPSKLTQLANTTQGYMVGDYLSTSFLTKTGGDAALSVFAVGLPVPGKTCTLGDVTSCREPMFAPTTPLKAAGAVRATVAAPVLSSGSRRPGVSARQTAR